MGVAELLAVLIFIVIFLLWRATRDAKVDRYDWSKVSKGKMAMDAGKNKNEVKRKLLNGEYDKDDHWKV